MKTSLVIAALSTPGLLAGSPEKPYRFPQDSGAKAISHNAIDENYNLGNKTSYTLFNPTPDSLLRELSPDRPDATESPLTVDAGRFALEASLVDYRRDGGIETYTYGQLNFKAGLTHDMDFQTVVDLYSDSDDGASGFGDVTMRLKWNLYGNDSGDSALALMPFVKIPTGTELSNDEWEGGLIIPWGTSLTETIGLGLMAEFDYVFNEDDGDHEFEFLHTAVLGFELTEKAGAYLEYIGISGEDTYQAYLAGGMNYAVNGHLILDFGVQSGLNSDSEDFGFFTGFTKRF
ncbi:MAG: transporter [Akkermansiaceae bacterium]